MHQELGKLNLKMVECGKEEPNVTIIMKVIPYKL